MITALAIWFGSAFAAFFIFVDDFRKTWDLTIGTAALIATVCLLGGPCSLLGSILVWLFTFFSTNNKVIWKKK